VFCFTVKVLDTLSYHTKILRCNVANLLDSGTKEILTSLAAEHVGTIEVVVLRCQSSYYPEHRPIMSGALPPPLPMTSQINSHGGHNGGTKPGKNKNKNKPKSKPKPFETQQPPLRSPPPGIVPPGSVVGSVNGSVLGLGGLFDGSSDKPNQGLGLDGSHDGSGIWPRRYSAGYRGLPRDMDFASDLEQTYARRGRRKYSPNGYERPPTRSYDTLFDDAEEWEDELNRGSTHRRQFGYYHPSRSFHDYPERHSVNYAHNYHPQESDEFESDPYLRCRELCRPYPYDARRGVYIPRASHEVHWQAHVEPERFYRYSDDDYRSFTGPSQVSDNLPYQRDFTRDYPRGRSPPPPPPPPPPSPPLRGSSGPFQHNGERHEVARRGSESIFSARNVQHHALHNLQRSPTRSVHFHSRSPPAHGSSVGPNQYTCPWNNDRDGNISPARSTTSKQSDRGTLTVPSQPAETGQWNIANSNVVVNVGKEPSKDVDKIKSGTHSGWGTSTNQVDENKNKREWGEPAAKDSYGGSGWGDDDSKKQNEKSAASWGITDKNNQNETSSGTWANDDDINKKQTSSGGWDTNDNSGNKVTSCEGWGTADDSKRNESSGDSWGIDNTNQNGTSGDGWGNNDKDHNIALDNDDWPNTDISQKAESSGGAWGVNESNQNKVSGNDSWSNNNNENSNEKPNNSWGNESHQNKPQENTLYRIGKHSQGSHPSHKNCPPIFFRRGDSWSDTGKNHAPDYADHNKKYDQQEELPLYGIPESITSSKHSSHQVQPGKPKKWGHITHRPAYLDSLKEPYAVFSFNYRSKGQ
jgi:hypothetical protein